ncbi:TetR family transcriptional regulator [Mycolicibacterium helvum]|uniref:TetR family transcriptional regulator n=2 Tax=Mycolicibacterium helvum TaxID=1534349 RepID=A0A7I7T194_9MYCO|nr:TetR family transcriptional regulator [Mycolicibacterium helvum]
MVHGFAQASAATTTESRTDTAILNAAAAVIGDYGERNLTIGQVAERAGCARMTVFRRFGSREQLLLATYSRELRRVIDSATQAVQTATTTVDCAEIMVAEFIDNALRHPIFIRLIRVEPGTVLALSRGISGFSAQELGATLFAHVLSDDRLDDPLPIRDATFIGDLLMRLVFSLSLVPAPEIEQSGESRRTYIRELVERIVPARDDQ